LIVAELSNRELEQRLNGPGLRLRTGPVVARIQSPLPSIVRAIALQYADYATEDEASFSDFRVRVGRPRNLRRWLRPQAQFFVDGNLPFTPLPLDQAFPMLEWGLNWCVSAHCHQYLIFHAAVVEKTGRALILPAPPGSGKSTLCAGLVNRGWRLLSDELTLIDLASCEVVPLPRPVSLKNASIDVIRAFAPTVTIGPTVRDTTKGSVAHMRAPSESVRRGMETARPGWIVLPRYEAGSAARLTPLSKGRGLMHMADNAFNYSAHGRRGFECLAQFVDRSSCYEFAYGDLEEAASVFSDLAAGP
jgi:HprK-related kinase A